MTTMYLKYRCYGSYVEFVRVVLFFPFVPAMYPAIYTVIWIVLVPFLGLLYDTWALFPITGFLFHYFVRWSITLGPQYVLGFSKKSHVLGYILRFEALNAYRVFQVS